MLMVYSRDGFTFSISLEKNFVKKNDIKRKKNLDNPKIRFKKTSET